jgi:hypothetical protein
VLRITADVNGRVISYLFIHNTGRQHKGNVWEYDAATWFPDAQDGTFGVEAIRHQRDEPWTSLVTKVAMQGGL